MFLRNKNVWLVSLIFTSITYRIQIIKNETEESQNKFSWKIQEVNDSQLMALNQFLTKDRLLRADMIQCWKIFCSKFSAKLSDIFLPCQFLWNLRKPLQVTKRSTKLMCESPHLVSVASLHRLNLSYQIWNLEGHLACNKAQPYPAGGG